MDNFMLSFIVFLVFIFVSRTINDKANKKLSSEQKAELVDLFSKSRTMTFGLMIVIIALYFLILEYKLFDPFLAFVIYILLLLSFILFNVLNARKKLIAHNFPGDYIKSHLIASTVKLAGILIFFALLI